MGKITEGFAKLRNKASVLLTHHNGHDQPRGGPQDKVEANIADSEEVQEDDVGGSDDDDSVQNHQAKSLQEFLNDDDSAEIQSRYGKFDLVQSQEDQQAYEPWVDRVSISAKSVGKALVFCG